MQSLRSGISPKAMVLCKAFGWEWRPPPGAKGILYRKALRTASSRFRRACADCFRSRLRRLGFASPPRARPRRGRGQTTTPSPRARSKPELSTLLESGTFYFALTEGGYTGLFDQRRGKRSIHRVAVETVEKVLQLSEESIRNQQNISYVRDAGEALAHVQGEPRANVVFLMNPCRASQVRDIALAGEVMPQKSTDFYPKLLSGLTIYALE